MRNLLAGRPIAALGSQVRQQVKLRTPPLGVHT